MMRIEQCSQCGSLNCQARYKDGTRYDPWKKGAPLWDLFHCLECGHVWKFTFIVLAEETHA